MQKITFDKQEDLSKQAQDDIMDILNKENAKEINIDFVDGLDHQGEYQTIKKMTWLNTYISWMTLCLCAIILVSLWTSNILIKVVLFMVLILFGWLYLNKWDTKIRQYLK